VSENFLAKPDAGFWPLLSAALRQSAWTTIRRVERGSASLLDAHTFRGQEKNPRNRGRERRPHLRHGSGSTIAADKLRRFLLTDTATSNAMAATNAGAAIDVKMVTML
jgi:hypothetical protein